MTRGSTSLTKGQRAASLLTALRADSTRYKAFTTYLRDEEFREMEQRRAGGGAGAAVLALLALLAAVALTAWVMYPDRAWGHYPDGHSDAAHEKVWKDTSPSAPAPRTPRETVPGLTIPYDPACESTITIRGGKREFCTTCQQPGNAPAIRVCQ